MSQQILSIHAIESHLEMLKNKQSELKNIKFSDLRDLNQALPIIADLYDLTGQIKAFNAILNGIPTIQE
ncbi:hypothetical protein [Hydrogenovibrio marinus]|uniref:Uncharacterized protein n=1 Tax=Hydrogenovibrio marinus TaxID=28885 RepID=A0A066ZWV0_HYDMR|nr:hypothetical protein [Hydrogenovibrio marinus]KDN94831.1 hypothetical protein EI16_00510 [Hydrogenovibrio marinus]BBN59290.1 hypothetical protein HVMH_0884 [Hydrogenovibrio marinus]